MAKNGKKQVRILFDHLTHSGKTYRRGDIVKNPTPHLMELAKTRATRIDHNNRNKDTMICEFYHGSRDGQIYHAEQLQEMDEKQLLKVLVRDMGFSRKRACEFDKIQMEDYILRLQE